MIYKEKENNNCSLMKMKYMYLQTRQPEKFPVPLFAQENDLQNGLKYIFIIQMPT